MERPVSICYSGNKAIFHGILLSVLSLVKYSDRTLHVHVLSMDLREQNPDYACISENQIDVLNAVLREKNAQSSAQLIDVTHLYRADLAKGKNANNHYTPYAQLRLYLSELQNIPDKILYLDADTMAAADAGELFDIDIDGYEYGAVLDYLGRFWISPTYCNSGVLLMNMVELKKTGLLPRVREFVPTRRMIMPDQTALHRLHTSRLILPDRFNEQRAIKSDTVIKHFCRGIAWFPFFHLYNIKQWDRDAVHKRLKIYRYDDVYAAFDRLAQRFDLTK